MTSRYMSSCRIVLLMLFGAAVTAAGACATGEQQLLDCGDGVVQPPELCDDGNTKSGDGCDDRCSVEPGFSCQGAMSACAPVCGDGTVVAPEECDGADVAGATCESAGFDKGTIACDATTCVLDTSACYSCGDSIAQGDEVCDGSDVGGASCTGEGFDGGALACTSGCALDTSGCTRISCGNGIVEGTEECDDDGLLALDGCSSNCSIESGWTCSGQPSTCTELCGNNQLDAGEQCDSAQLGGQDCVGLGFDGGTLGCTSGCTHDTTGCTRFSCGDGQITTGETCDGTDLAGGTCASVGDFIGGTLLCSSTNCLYDVSGCIPIRCGDGVISTGEACDDNNAGSGDGCNILCSVETGWECSGEPSVCTRLCGNNTVNTGEQCDGGQLDGTACTDLGFDLGNLACNADCTFNTADCSTFSCGDGMVTGIEDCDGANLNGSDCQSEGAFVGGALACTGSCSYDVTGCIPVRCGDGIVSPGEQCDDNGTVSGDGCNSACQVENGWLCTGAPSTCELSCGNGNVDPGEDCDGTDLNAKTCKTQGFAGGDLACSACSFDTTACLESICPNGIKEGSEGCDGSDFGGKQCSDFGFVGGSLACTGTCTLDTTSCVNAVCGNSAVEPGEQCDDNNTTAGDGCSDTCQWEQTCTADETIACGGSDHQTSINGNGISSYVCSGSSSSGGSVEHAYALTIPAGITSVTASLDCDDWDDDYDLFILGGACNPKLCVDRGISGSCDSVTFAVTPGQTYYLSVEEYWLDSFWGGYTLSVSCN